MYKANTKATDIKAIPAIKSIESTLFLVMGFLSLFVTAVFIYHIKNYKRMLAYSSIENDLVLFVIDTLFILLLSRGTSCNHCYIYWIMSYFFGLMSMYVVMFYYWHLENKHKDVLAEVE